HPPELGEEIRARFPSYRCDLDVGLKEKPDTLKAHLDDIAFQNLAVMRTLAREKDWDLFIGVFTTTDRAKHMFWDKRETLVRDHYRHVDRAVGELLAELGDDVLVVLLSDHGFHTVKTKFYINRWLRENGWLDVREATPEGDDLSDEEKELHKGLEVFMAPARSKPGFLKRLFGRKDDGVQLEIDMDKTKAYLYSAWSNGIKINVKGGGPVGTVEPGDEYEALRDAIIDGLRSQTFPDSEEPLFDFVGRREEVYKGARIDWAPDVVTRSDGFRVVCGKNLDTGRLVRVSGHDAGQHSDTGIVVLKGEGVPAGTEFTGAGIVDTMPTVLWALGVPVPEGLDGRALTHAFDEAVVAANPVQAGAASPAEPADDAGSFDADEEEELRKTLEGLGYI
ncbi:MAG: alkaline phosphatase family protein, partial [Planctomycetota bacterium]